VEIVAPEGEEPFVRSWSSNGIDRVTLRVPGWRLATRPYFSARLRLPALRESDPLKLDVVLQCDNGMVLTVPLNEAESFERALRTPVEKPWEAGVWQGVCIDVTQALAGEDTSDMLRQAAFVESVSITRTDGGDRKPLDLQAVCVHGAWQAGDALALKAYDASGIGEVLWEYTDGEGRRVERGSCPGDSVAPADLPFTPRRDGWLKLHVRDKAGNLSLPVRVPVPASG
jgi:hypothetical protein